MEFFKAYVKQKRSSILRFVLMCSIFLCVFALYHLPVAAVLYPAGLCALLGVCFWGLDYKRAKEKHEKLVILQKLSAELLRDFPEAEGIVEQDYQQLLQILCDEQAALVTKMNASYTDMTEYYTIWAHQIKTPIASMRLHLQNEDTDVSRQLSEDLQRIEQYVANGGTVVATYLTGYTNESDLCHLGGFPGHKLKEVFGLTVNEIDSLEPDELKGVIMGSKTYDVKNYCELAQAEAAEVIATYTEGFFTGTGAVFKNKYNRTSVIHFKNTHCGCFCIVCHKID